MEHERARCSGRTIGVVLFARGPCPEWIHPVFRMELGSDKGGYVNFDSNLLPV